MADESIDLKRISALSTEATRSDWLANTFFAVDNASIGTKKLAASILVTILNNFAKEFKSDVACVAGKCYWKDGVLYKCKNDHSGTWSDNDFEEATIDDIKQTLAHLLPNEKHDGYLALSDTNGMGKFDIEKIFNNFAGKFDPDKNGGYTVNEHVIYEGSLYEFINPHLGAWDSHNVVEIPTDLLITGINNLFVSGRTLLWEQGGLVSSDGTETVSSARIRTKLLTVTKNTKIEFNRSFGPVRVYAYDYNNDYVEYTVLNDSAYISYPEGYRIRICAGYNNENDKTIAFKHAVGVNVSGVVLDDSNSVIGPVPVVSPERVKNDIAYKFNLLGKIRVPKWELGGLSSSGTLSNNANRIRTSDFLEVDSSGTVTVDWKSFNRQRIEVQSGYKLRFVIITTDNRDVDLSLADEVNLKISGLVPSYSNLTWEIGTIYADGSELDSTTRLRTTDYYEVSGNVTVDYNSVLNVRVRYFVYNTSDEYVSNGYVDGLYYFNLYKYDSTKAFVSYEKFTGSDRNSIQVACTAGSFVKIAVFPDEGTSFDSNILAYLQFIIGGVVLNDENSELVYEKPVDISQVDNEIELRNQLFSTTRVLKWAIGTIYADGTDTNSNTRLRTNVYYEVTDDVILNFTSVADTRVRYFVYNGNSEYVSNGYADYNGYAISVQSGYKLRFVLVTTDNRLVDLSLARDVRLVVSGVVLNDDNSDWVYARISGTDSEYADLTGKTVAFIGDSITYGVGSTDNLNYVNDFASITGCTSINLGYSGTCIAVGSKKVPNNDDHCFVTRATAENIGTADLIVVFGGTNDFSYNSKPIGDSFVEETITAHDNIGSKQLIAPTDLETFSGALHNLLQTILNNAKQGAQLLLLTPMQRKNYNVINPNSAQSNANGEFMMDYVKSIKEIGSFYSVPILDMYNDAEFCRLSPYFDNYFPDGIHPNNAGHLVIAKKIAKFVKSNIVL